MPGFFKVTDVVVNFCPFNNLVLGSFKREGGTALNERFATKLRCLWSKLLYFLFPAHFCKSKDSQFCRSEDVDEDANEASGNPGLVFG